MHSHFVASYSYSPSSRPSFTCEPLYLKRSLPQIDYYPAVVFSANIYHGDLKGTFIPFGIRSGRFILLSLIAFCLHFHYGTYEVFWLPIKFKGTYYYVGPSLRTPRIEGTRLPLLLRSFQFSLHYILECIGEANCRCWRGLTLVERLLPRFLVTLFSFVGETYCQFLNRFL